MSTFTSGHALLIGIGTYQDSRWNVPITVNDVQGLADALKDPTASAYPVEQITLLTAAQATRVGVICTLQEFATRVSTEDTSLLFLCGHGAPGTDGVYHFATYDTVFTSDNRVQAGTGISRDVLLPLLSSIKARKLLLLINACFSGYMHPGVLGAPPASTLGIDILSTGEGRALITASRPTQYSYYSHKDQRTFFGQALIDGLHGQAITSGGYVGLYELYQYLYTRVQVAAAGVNGVQEPVLTIQQGVGPFPVALTHHADAGNLNVGAIRQQPPPDTAVAVISPDVVQAVGQTRQTVDINSGGNTTIDQSHKLIDFGGAIIRGNVSLGDVAARDMTKIDIKVTTAAAAAVDSKAELLQLIAQVQADLATLKDLSDDDRDDVSDALRKATKAGEENKKERLLDKLDTAQQILIKLGSSIPAAVKLGETIGVLIQRAIQAF